MWIVHYPVGSLIGPCHSGGVVLEDRPGWRPPPEIVALIAQLLTGGEVTVIGPLVGGDLNDSVVVEIAGGERLVVRRPRAPGSPWLPTVGGQVAAHRLAQECGVPVAQIVATSQEGIVYRYVPGQPIGPGIALGADPSGSTIPPLLAEKAGATYGLLHARRGRGLGAIQPDGSASGWPEEGYFDVTVDRATRILQLGADSLGLNQVDLETASEILSNRRPAVRSRFIHGDASPANTIIDPGHNRIAALVDFDAAAWADPAIDLAWWWYHSPDTAEAFAGSCAAVSETTEPETALLYRLRLLIGLAEVVAPVNRSQLVRIDRLLSQTVLALKT